MLAPSPPRPTRRAWSLGFLVALVAAAVYSRFGNQGLLFHDDALFLYGGQELVRGTPVYEGLFDHKGPLGQLLCGLGVWLADLTGRDQVAVTRYLFLGVASGCVAGVYWLALSLFGSTALSLSTSAWFVSFWGFGQYAFSGNRPKMLMVLFQVAALALAARRAWFLTGLAATLGAYTWQPAGVYFLVALVLALVGEERGGRARAVVHLVLGGAVPTLALCVYFALAGAFASFLDGCFLFNLTYLDNPGTLAVQFRSAMQLVLYSGMGIPTLIGLVLLLALYPLRWRGKSWRERARDPSALLLFSYPFPLLWSLRDFQQYPDFFVFLPYVALALGWGTHVALNAIADQLDARGGARAALLLFPALALTTFSAVAYGFRAEERLSEQRGWAAQLVRDHGDGRLAAIGVPAPLVLLDRPNVTRYGFVMRGIREYIDDHEPGGFPGWLQSISDAAPDVLLVDDDYPRRLGPFADDWRRWLETWRRAPDIGPWSVYLPRSDERD